MCMTCGCHRPDDHHGNPHHIVWSKFAAAAKAAGIPPTRAAINLVATLPDAMGPPDPDQPGE
jgi:hypothetical protein